MRVSDYAKGDRVRHPNGAEGEVVAVEPTRFGDIGVRVDWGPVPDTGQKWPYPKRRWQEHYDDAWLRQHDLTKISH